MKCQNLKYYFIIDRINGKSYDPYVCMDKYLIAYSNCATDTKAFVISFNKLLQGLKEKRYRLILKNNL